MGGGEGVVILGGIKGLTEKSDEGQRKTLATQYLLHCKSVASQVFSSVELQGILMQDHAQEQGSHFMAAHSISELTGVAMYNL